MPFDGPAGFSKDTPVKQEHFRTVLQVHLLVVQAILQKHSWAHREYLYLDLTAGPGIVDGAMGSPLIFLQEATRLGIPFRAYFCEQKPNAVLRLREAVNRLHAKVGPFSGVWSVLEGDSKDTIGSLIANKLRGLPAKGYGLAYADPNGTDIPIDTMRRLADVPKLATLDFLVHVGATHYKRGGLKTGLLRTDLRRIGKPYMQFREPIGIHQWTFAILTGWNAFPKFAPIGFWPADSPAGQRIEDLLNLTREEFERRGMLPLPFDDPHPTEPTPNTCDTPGSAP